VTAASGVAASGRAFPMPPASSASSPVVSFKVHLKTQETDVRHLKTQETDVRK